MGAGVDDSAGKGTWEYRLDLCLMRRTHAEVEGAHRFHKVDPHMSDVVPSPPYTSYTHSNNKQIQITDSL